MAHVELSRKEKQLFCHWTRAAKIAKYNLRKNVPDRSPHTKDLSFRAYTDAFQAFEIKMCEAAGLTWDEGLRLLMAAIGEGRLDVSFLQKAPAEQA